MSWWAGRDGRLRGGAGVRGAVGPLGAAGVGCDGGAGALDKEGAELREVVTVCGDRVGGGSLFDCHETEELADFSLHLLGRPFENQSHSLGSYLHMGACRSPTRTGRASQACESCGDRGSANSALATRGLPEQAIGAKNGQALRVRDSRTAVAAGLEAAVDGPVDGARSCPRRGSRGAQSSVLICSATRFVMPGVDAMSATEASRMACSEPNLRSRAFLRVGPMPRMRSSGLWVARCRRRRRW